MTGTFFAFYFRGSKQMSHTSVSLSRFQDVGGDLFTFVAAPRLGAFIVFFVFPFFRTSFSKMDRIGYVLLVLALMSVVAYHAYVLVYVPYYFPAGLEAFDGCPAGKINCFGECTNTQTDVQNCGQCGIVCGTGQFCGKGECLLTCPKGQRDCAGYCVNTSSDSRNCGRCGVVCRQGQTCRNGKCIGQVKQCPAGCRPI